MAMANRRKHSNRRNRERGNSPAHPSEAELAGDEQPVSVPKPPRKAAKKKPPAKKRRR